MSFTNLDDWLARNPAKAAARARAEVAEDVRRAKEAWQDARRMFTDLEAKLAKDPIEDGKLADAADRLLGNIERALGEYRKELVRLEVEDLDAE